MIHPLHIHVDSDRCKDGSKDHDWSGFREISMGGEAFCVKCGMGAMHHSLMFMDDIEPDPEIRKSKEGP